MTWTRTLGAVLLTLVLLGSASARAQGSGQTAAELWQQGYALHMLGAFDEALQLYRRSIEIGPTAEAHTYLGWALSHLGRLEEAIAQCKAAIAVDPGFGNPYNDIGAYLIELGRPDEAVPWLEQAMATERYCCYQFPHFNMGRILVLQGRLEAAEGAFERVLDYVPDYAPALRALELIRQQERSL